MTIVYDHNDIGAAEFCSHGNYSEKQHNRKRKGTKKLSPGEEERLGHSD